MGFWVPSQSPPMGGEWDVPPVPHLTPVSQRVAGTPQLLEGPQIFPPPLFQAGSVNPKDPIPIHGDGDVRLGAGTETGDPKGYGGHLSLLLLPRAGSGYGPELFPRLEEMPSAPRLGSLPITNA